MIKLGRSSGKTAEFNPDEPLFKLDEPLSSDYKPHNLAGGFLEQVEGGLVGDLDFTKGEALRNSFVVFLRKNRSIKKLEQISYDDFSRILKDGGIVDVDEKVIEEFLQDLKERSIEGLVNKLIESIVIESGLEIADRDGLTAHFHEVADRVLEEYRKTKLSEHEVREFVGEKNPPDILRKYFKVDETKPPNINLIFDRLKGKLSGAYIYNVEQKLLKEGRITEKFSDEQKELLKKHFQDFLSENPGKKFENMSEDEVEIVLSASGVEKNIFISGLQKRLTDEGLITKDFTDEQKEYLTKQLEFFLSKGPDQSLEFISPYELQVMLIGLPGESELKNVDPDVIEEVFIIKDEESYESPITPEWRVGTIAGKERDAGAIAIGGERAVTPKWVASSVPAKKEKSDVKIGEQRQEASEKDSEEDSGPA